MAWGKVKDQDFVGKEAYVSHRESEPVAKLCTLTIDDHTSASGVKRYPLGREPVTTRDGKPIAAAHGSQSRCAMELCDQARVPCQAGHGSNAVEQHQVVRASAPGRPGSR